MILYLFCSDNPTESIFVTSSYVKTPPIEALPLIFNPVAVIIPVELI